MTGFVVERHGYLTATTLIADLVNDMIAQGFTLIYENLDSKNTWNVSTAAAPYKVILEAGPTVDPLNDPAQPTVQPWRVCFNLQADQTVFMFTGTPTTLPASGVLPVTYDFLAGSTASGAGYQSTDVAGSIGAKMTTAKTVASSTPSNAGAQLTAPDYTQLPATISSYLSQELVSATGTYTPPATIPAYKVVGTINPSFLSYLAPSKTNPWFLNDGLCMWVVDPTGVSNSGALTIANSSDDTTKGFINRALRLGSASTTTAPMSYRLVISPRGFWVGVWEDAATQETSALFNWVLIQRPVDRTTGAVLTTGKCPVFCVNGIGGEYWQFVVRENDILKPGTRRTADSDSADSEAIFNSSNQVSLSEDGRYIVTFPSRLNSSRYRYPHELDMIGITSADVVAQYSSVPLTVYGEAQPRTYMALQANGTGSTGMRILVLTQGGGIS